MLTSIWNMGTGSQPRARDPESQLHLSTLLRVGWVAEYSMVAGFQQSRYVDMRLISTFLVV